MERIDKLPPDAKRVHLHSFENVLAPRGRHEKESLSQRLLETLIAEYESWTDPAYSDSRPSDEVLYKLYDRVWVEVSDALNDLAEYVSQKGKTVAERREYLRLPEFVALRDFGNANKRVMYGLFPCKIKYSDTDPGVDAWAAVNLDDKTDVIPFRLGVIWDTHRFVNPYTGESWNTLEDCLDDVRVDDTLELGRIELTNEE